MSTANQDASDLFLAPFQGLISEDVMAKLNIVNRIPLPFADSIGSVGTANQFTEWLLDQLADPDITNAAVDGADLTGDDSAEGTRVGNHHQIMTKVVRVSTRAQDVNTLGFENALSHQIVMRQQELLRDYEAISLEPQASVRGTSSVEGRMGGFPSWLETSTFRGVGGADGGFDGAGIVDAPTAGAARGLTETLVRDAAQSAYVAGGNPSILMSVTGVIRELSNYLFTDSARIASLRRTSSDGTDVGPAQAQGAVNIFLTDFEVQLELRANRLQQTHLDDAIIQVADVLLYDPSMVSRGILTNVRVEPLAKTGLADNRSMVIDGTVVVNHEAAHALIADIDPTTTVVLV